jgi:hypothetical protein
MAHHSFSSAAWAFPPSTSAAKSALIPAVLWQDLGGIAATGGRRRPPLLTMARSIDLHGPLPAAPAQRQSRTDFIGLGQAHEPARRGDDGVTAQPRRQATSDFHMLV